MPFVDKPLFAAPQDEDRGTAGNRWAARHDASARDTIFALSTPLGRSAVAIIRMSGPGAGRALANLTGTGVIPRVAKFASFHAKDGRKIDEGLALWFPAPASFTGEDCAEVQCHGSIAAIRAILATLAEMPDLREAKPGEFTQRAFANGKLDLARTEALADLIEAQTERQRRLAVRATSDGPAKLAAEWRDAILDVLASIDARLDFADEGDVDALQNDMLVEQLDGVADAVDKIVEASRSAARIRDGFVVALCGPPNAGKSTLLNALVGREQAIVSPHPGTTRDTIEAALDVNGALVTFVDTAGLRETQDDVERIGVDRAHEAATRADMVIWLSAPDAFAVPPPGLRIDLRVGTKADLGSVRPDCDVAISATHRQGLEKISAIVSARAGLGNQEIGDAASLRERHVVAAKLLAQELHAASLQLRADSPELAAEHLRHALAASERLGSKTADEDVLDRIFGRFCIGK